MSAISISAVIHPSSVLEGDIIIKDNVIIGPLCYIKGPIHIEENTWIGAGCIIGAEAEHRTRPSDGSVYIGKNTVIKEGVVIHKGIDGIITTIGDDCYIMNQSYIAHDCILAQQIVLSSHVCLAGKVRLLTGCNLGMGVIVHQHVTIGAHSMLGMGSVITKDILPFSTVYGNPAVCKKWNSHKFSTLGISENDLEWHNNRLISPTNHAVVEQEIEIFYQLSQKKQLFFDGRK